MAEFRHSHRVKFNGLVEFETSECCHVCELIDISIKGALIAGCTGATPPAGTACKLTLTLDETGQIQIIMIGTTTHKIENRVGIHCQFIDSDSMIHLRKLIEYNLGDVKLMNRDFNALLHTER
jgi:hypothetical protein